MKIPQIVLSAAFLVTGCGSDSNVNALETDMQQEQINTVATDTETTPGGGSSSVLAFYNGATFVAVESTVVNGIPTGSFTTVSFTNDTVSWNQAGVVTTGSYSNASTTASFTDLDVTFEKDGSNIIWNETSYRRAAISAFDSQESLKALVDGAVFASQQLFLGGENELGEVLSDNWSLRFNGDEASWAYTDVIEIATYTYVSNSIFNINFANRDRSVVVLDSGELVMNSVIYEKEITSQFSSQNTLITYLNDASYKSVELSSLGAGANGQTALGYWFIDFTGNTFSWSYEDISESGTYTYLNDDSFTATFIMSVPTDSDTAVNREYTITVEGDDILWDNKRYTRVVGQ